MHKRGGRPGPSPSPSPASSPSLSSNPQPLHADGQRRHIGPSSDPQEHVQTESPSLPSSSLPSPSVPPSSVQHSNDEGNTGEEDSQVMICSYGDSFTSATYVVRQLSKIINNYWRGPWISYSIAPKEVKNLWWNEFKFRWDEMEEDEIKRIFKKKAGDHIRNAMNRARRRQQKPDFITCDDWTEMKQTWETEKNAQKSEQNKKKIELLVLVKGLPHMLEALSISRSIEKEWQMNWGRNRHIQLHLNAHFKKKYKTWTSDRAKAIKEKYDELLMSTASGGDGVDASEQSGDNMALWMEASGGMKKGKIFGMGSLSRIYKSAAATLSFNAGSSRRSQHEEEMTQEINQLKHLIVERDEEIREVKSQYKSLQNQMQIVMQHLNIDHNQVPPVPPCPQMDDEQHNDDDEIADDDDD